MHVVLGAECDPMSHWWGKMLLSRSMCSGNIKLLSLVNFFMTVPITACGDHLQCVTDLSWY